MFGRIHGSEIMASWQSQIKNVATAIAVLSGIVMVLSVGVGEVLTVVLDPTTVTAETNATFGGSVDTIDRLAVVGVATTVLGTAGLGILTQGRNNPPFINTLLRYMPVIVGLIGFTAFSTEVFEILQGDRVWANFDDATNSYMLFLASSFVAGLVSLFRSN
jgi:hypothetical protein